MKTAIALMVLLVFTSPVFAQQEDAAETYTDTGMPAPEEDVSKPSGFHGILGGGFFTTKRILGDNHRLIILGPVILMRYEDIAYWSLTGGGVWLAQTEDHSFRLGAGARTHAGWHPGHDPNRAGMGARRGSVDGYLNAVWRTPPATFGAHYYHDILNSSRGDTASIRVSKKLDMGEDTWLIPSIGVEWQSGARVNYYYGVRPEEALSSRPPYTGTSAINTNIGLSGLYRLSDSWSLLGSVFMTRYGKSIFDSPIVTRRYSAVLFFGAGWRF